MLTGEEWGCGSWLAARGGALCKLCFHATFSAIGLRSHTDINGFLNAGVVLPKLVLFALVDLLTARTCVGADPSLSAHACPHSRTAGRAGNACTRAGGECAVSRDGYYALSYSAVIVGAVLFVWFRRVMPRLEALPLDQWHAKKRRQ